MSLSVPVWIVQKLQIISTHLLWDSAAFLTLKWRLINKLWWCLSGLLDCLTDTGEWIMIRGNKQKYKTCFLASGEEDLSPQSHSTSVRRCFLTDLSLFIRKSCSFWYSDHIWTLSRRRSSFTCLFVSTGDSSAHCAFIPGLHSDLQANVSRVEWLRVKEVLKLSSFHFLPSSTSFKEIMGLFFFKKGWLVRNVFLCRPQPVS